MKTDLNLLRVFDVLMELRSVSRAADRLGLTQSAISHALARLRDQLGDPLFVRARGGLRPTARAAELAPAVRDALAMLHDALTPTRFDPAGTDRLFTICASPYFNVTLLPFLIQRARSEAPQARFRIVAPTPDLVSDLDEGSIDLTLGSFGAVPSRFASAILYSERVVWVGRADTDFADLSERPRLALTRPRQFITAGGRTNRATLDERLEIISAALSPDASTPLTIYDVLSAIAFVRTSDLVTLIPRQLAAMLAGRQDVVTMDAADQAPITVSMLWHARNTGEPGHSWLRGLMAEAAAGLG